MSWVSWPPGKSSPFGIGDIYVLDMGPATMALHPAADLTICQIQKHSKFSRTGQVQQKYAHAPRQKRRKYIVYLTTPER